MDNLITISDFDKYINHFSSISKNCYDVDVISDRIASYFQLRGIPKCEMAKFVGKCLAKCELKSYKKYFEFFFHCEKIYCDSGGEVCSLRTARKLIWLSLYKTSAKLVPNIILLLGNKSTSIYEQLVNNLDYQLENFIIANYNTTVRNQDRGVENSITPEMFVKALPKKFLAYIPYSEFFISEIVLYNSATSVNFNNKIIETDIDALKQHSRFFDECDGIIPNLKFVGINGDDANPELFELILGIINDDKDCYQKLDTLNMVDIIDMYKLCCEVGIRQSDIKTRLRQIVKQRIRFNRVDQNQSSSSKTPKPVKIKFVKDLIMVNTCGSCQRSWHRDQILKIVRDSYLQGLCRLAKGSGRDFIWVLLRNKLVLKCRCSKWTTCAVVWSTETLSDTHLNYVFDVIDPNY